MKESSEAIVRRLMKSEFNLWERTDLELLQVKHLDLLFGLLGTPRYSQLNRAQRITKMLIIAKVRMALAPFKLTPEMPHEEQKRTVAAVSKRFNGKLLKELCRSAGTFAPSTKYGMAASLMQWRNGCRRNGQKVWEEAMEIRRQRPHIQKSLPLWNPQNDKTVG